MKLNDFNRKLKKEYSDTFKEIKFKRSWNFEFKFRYVIYACLMVFGLFLIGEHISVSIYNNRMEAIKQERLNSNDYNKIDNYDDYLKIRKYYSIDKKESLLSAFLSMEIGCAAKKGEAMPPMDNNGNSFDTNVQTKGIDEADISKCDGKYVYSLANSMLKIYDLNGNVVSSINDMGDELYVKDDIIITLGASDCIIYRFDGSLVLSVNFCYDEYIDSRLVDDHVYLVVRNKINKENLLYGDCYYDELSSPVCAYSIIDVDLKNNNYDVVQTLAGWDVSIYMSNSNFYVASESYYDGPITSIMMYDNELNPVGLMKVEGTVLNQFSMDEYNGYFRVVSTDSTKDAERLNSISVFDLSNLEKVGYLNEGIGISRQVIKSVRFEGDTCYCVTYENRDPLYEINLSDPTNPVIVSKYEAPGYSNYLHTFVINDKEYVLGLGYTDSRINTKISVYVNDENTTQIGEDYILGYNNYYDQCDFISDNINEDMFVNHKALFIYNDNNYLYLGSNVCSDQYVIFKIDVNDTSNIVSIYKTVQIDFIYDCRSFLVDGKLLVTTIDKLLVFDWD